MRKTEQHAGLDTWPARIESLLDRHLPTAEGPTARLASAMRHATLGGGKRLRPCLVYAAGTACSAALEQLDHAAVAVELVHVYSLIHDDLPAMDDDALRRGKPTVHVAFDEATAILAGDALQSQAFEVLAATPLPAERVVKMLHALATAIGLPGMCGGQAADVEATGRRLDEGSLQRMHAMKTGALIRASVRLGAVAAGASEERCEALDRFASALGLAFQIKDDLLDAEGDTTSLGKTAGKDEADGKSTYVGLLGLEGARAHLDAVSATMFAELNSMDGEVSALRALASLTVQRRH